MPGMGRGYERDRQETTQWKATQTLPQVQWKTSTSGHNRIAWIRPALLLRTSMNAGEDGTLQPSWPERGVGAWGCPEGRDWRGSRKMSPKFCIWFPFNSYTEEKKRKKKEGKKKKTRKEPRTKWKAAVERLSADRRLQQWCWGAQGPGAGSAGRKGSVNRPTQTTSTTQKNIKCSCM